jgi:hypothetical protein
MCDQLSETDVCEASLISVLFMLRVLIQVQVKSEDYGKHSEAFGCSRTYDFRLSDW